VDNLQLKNADLAWLKLLLDYPAISLHDSLRIVRALGFSRNETHHHTRVLQLSGAAENKAGSKQKRRKLPKNGRVVSRFLYDGPAYASEDGAPYSHRIALYSLTPAGASLVTGQSNPVLPRRDQREGWRSHYQTAFLTDLIKAGVPADAISPALNIKRQLALPDRVPMSLAVAPASGRGLYCVTLFAAGLDCSRRWTCTLEYARAFSDSRNAPGGGLVRYVVVVPASMYLNAYNLLREQSYETHLLVYSSAARTLANLRVDPACYIGDLARRLGAVPAEYFGPKRSFHYTAALGPGREVFLCELVSGNLKTLRELKSYTGSREVYCLISKQQAALLKSEIPADKKGVKFVMFETGVF
jgi:hypothetical protein